MHKYRLLNKISLFAQSNQFVFMQYLDACCTICFLFNSQRGRTLHQDFLEIWHIYRLVYNGLMKKILEQPESTDGWEDNFNVPWQPEYNNFEAATPRKVSWDTMGKLSCMWKVRLGVLRTVQQQRKGVKIWMDGNLLVALKCILDLPRPARVRGTL